MRVVLDTNILVSACWTPDGLEAQLVALVIAGEFTVCVSAEVLAEYRDVLSRPKLAAVSARARENLAALERASVFVEPAERIAASVDEDDNRFLECAAAARAEFLITGNLRHYPATWRGAHGAIRIVNARAFFAAQTLRDNPLQ